MRRLNFFAAVAASCLIFSAAGAIAKTVDAIAIDDEEGLKGGDAGYGVGEGSSEAEAGKAAMKECKKAGNDGCQIAITYDKCGAYASSKKHGGTGTGDTEAEAKKAALEGCGGGACKVVVSDCVEK